MSRTTQNRPAGAPGRRGRGAGRGGYARPRRAGQVLILVLVGMTLLVGVLFYVYNVGDQVNRRLEMQAAADAVAISGADWMARNMNVVAMNNVGIAKTLSLVPILDAQPLASEMAYNETAAWERMLAGILAHRPVDPGVSATTEAYLSGGIEALRARMATQRDILRPFAEAINPPRFDMESITHWRRRGASGPAPHGMLWRAAVTMEELNRAAVESCGVLAQERAVRLGEMNNATAAFLVPVVPEMPARMGHYLDFQGTLMGRCEVRSNSGYSEPTGGNGGAIPDFAFPHRLGPWARLHRWRDYFTEFIETGRTWVPGVPGRGRTRGSHGNVNVGARKVGRSARTPTGGGRPGHWSVQGYHQRLGYRTYGPYAWALRHSHWWARGTNENPGKLRDTYYWEYMRRIADIKLNYMFPPDGVPAQTVEIHKPNWVVGYEESKAIGENPDNLVTSTLFFVVEIASRFPEGSPGFMSPGSYRTNADPRNPYPIAMWAPGWQDPEKWGIERIPTNYVWKDAYVYETTEDRELGIRRETIPPGDPDGEEVWHPVYMYAWYIFGGIDIGGTVEVSNPANWDGDEWAAQLLPQPVLLDTSTGDYGSDDPDVGWRRERFTFLGIARQRTEAPVWPQQFRHANPIEGTLAVAQAKLFNKQSWGLWTQDWRVQLMPVTRIGPASDPQSWTARLEADIAAAESVPSVETQEVETAWQYLSSLDPEMARVYMTH